MSKQIYKTPFIINYTGIVEDMVCGTGPQEGGEEKTDPGEGGPEAATKSINIVDFSSDTSDDW